MVEKVTGVGPPSETREDLTMFNVSDDALERMAVVIASTLISCTLDISCPSSLALYDRLLIHRQAWAERTRALSALTQAGPPRGNQLPRRRHAVPVCNAGTGPQDPPDMSRLGFVPAVGELVGDRCAL
jgi:hypothetical protein